MRPFFGIRNCQFEFCFAVGQNYTNATQEGDPARRSKCWMCCRMRRHQIIRIRLALSELFFDHGATAQALWPSKFSRLSKHKRKCKSSDALCKSGTNKPLFLSSIPALLALAVSAGAFPVGRPLAIVAHEKKKALGRGAIVTFIRIPLNQSG